MSVYDPTLDEAIAHCRDRLTRYHCDNHPTAPVPVFQQHLQVLLDAVTAKEKTNGDSKEQQTAPLSPDRD